MMLNQYKKFSKNVPNRKASTKDKHRKVCVDHPIFRFHKHVSIYLDNIPPTYFTE